MSREPKTEFDPVTLEILWNRLISIADQSATTLVRTSFSTVVRECNDYACVLMDRNGDTLAENRGSIPSDADRTSSSRSSRRGARSCP